MISHPSHYLLVIPLPFLFFMYGLRFLLVISIFSFNGSPSTSVSLFLFPFVNLGLLSLDGIERGMGRPKSDRIRLSFDFLFV